MSGFKDWIDTAAEVVENSINNSQAAAERDNIANWTAEGRQAGETAAREDFETGQWQTNPVVEVVQPSDANIPEGSTYSEFHMPSFFNPILTGLEVALTPTELGRGDFAQERSFDAGHADGYSEGMFKAFDQQLEEHFALPPAPEPSSIAPSAIDCAIPPLDPSPTVDWSACDNGGDYDSGGGSYDSGGSSSGGGSDGGSSD